MIVRDKPSLRPPKEFTEDFFRPRKLTANAFHFSRIVHSQRPVRFIYPIWIRLSQVYVTYRRTVSIQRRTSCVPSTKRYALETSQWSSLSAAPIAILFATSILQVVMNCFWACCPRALGVYMDQFSHL